MRKNTALARWRAGDRTVGGWLTLANTHVAEMMAHAGFDWLCLDLQHGLLDYKDLLHMLPAISTTETTPLVRVSGNDPTEIMKVLDAGAMGVIVPLVNTRREAIAAISACRYPPSGSRSFGPMRARLYGGSDYPTAANDEIACVVMIETMESFENLDSIVSTPGLSGVYVGPNDLALSMGMPAVGDTDDARHVAAVDKILTACKRFNVPAGIHAGSIEYGRRRLEAGFNFVTVGSDAGLMIEAANAALAATRG